MLPKRKTPFRSRRSKKRQHRRHIIKSTIAAILVVIFSVLVWYGTRRPEFIITSISVGGGETVPYDLIEKKANDTLVGTYALLIPKRFIYLYPHDRIMQAVESIPRVKEAYITRITKNELSITFNEYTPDALWCDSVSTSSSTPSRCLFVDEFGYAFSSAPNLRGGALVRYITETTKPAIDKFILPQSTLLIFKSFTEALAKRHLMRIHAITLTKDNDLIFNLNTGADILINKDSDIQTIFDNLESILSSEEFSSLAPGDFDYIDLRFGNKIYIKEEVDVSAEESERDEGDIKEEEPSELEAVTAQEEQG